MNMAERIERLERSMFGNGKRGVFERIGRLEIMATIIISLQIPIIIMLVKMLFSK